LYISQKLGGAEGVAALVAVEEAVAAAETVAGVVAVVGAVAVVEVCGKNQKIMSLDLKMELEICIKLTSNYFILCVPFVYMISTYLKK
jgi:hypothetical protein